MNAARTAGPLRRLACWRGHRGASAPRPVAAGQGLVEFAMLLPVFMLLLLGMLEFGFAFTHNQTLEYATREGARTGAALSNGTPTYPCTTANFDAPIIAAVERVLNSTGSPVKDRLTANAIPIIEVYLADAAGNKTTSVDTWTYSKGAGPVVDGQPLDYKLTSLGWSPCSRNNGVNADGLGVSLGYTYQFQTALGGILRFFGGTGWSSLVMSDRTVMNLNPTQ